MLPAQRRVQGQTSSGPYFRSGFQARLPQGLWLWADPRISWGGQWGTRPGSRQAQGRVARELEQDTGWAEGFDLSREVRFVGFNPPGLGGRKEGSQPPPPQRGAAGPHLGAQLRWSCGAGVLGRGRERSLAGGSLEQREALCTWAIASAPEGASRPRRGFSIWRSRSGFFPG